MISDDKQKAYYMTIRKALLEQVDALERLLDINRTAELRAENQELKRLVAELQKSGTIPLN